MIFGRDTTMRLVDSDTLRGPHHRPRRPSLVVLAGFALAFSAFVGLSLHVGLEGSLVVSLLLALALGACAIALKAPLMTIVLVFVLGQVTGHEFQWLIPEQLRNPLVLGIRLRHSDPMYLGIVVAIVVRLVAGDTARVRQTIRQQGFLLLLLVSLTVSAVRGIGDYGVVNAFGEFRTYYQYLLLVPYITLSIRSAEHQWRMFMVLVVLSLFMIPLALFRGGVVSGFGLFGSGAGHGARWFSASGGLSMLFGVVAIVVAQPLRVIKGGSLRTMTLVALFVVLLLLNPHRSVWLASMVTTMGAIGAGLIPLRRQLAIVIITVLAAAAVFISVPRFATDSVAILGQRASAFITPEDDPTTSWRVHLWTQSLAQVRNEPVLGVGLGRHFQLYDFAGELVTTSPHNFYITLLLHAGFVGLLLYALFIGAAFAFLVRALAHRHDGARSRTILLVAAISLPAISAFFIAYSSEHLHLPWSILGLGLAVALSLARKREIGRH